LHGSEIDEDNPKNVITDYRKLVAIAYDDKAGNDSPKTEEKRNHRKFDVDKRYRIEN
jgi:hypothetical protein